MMTGSNEVIRAPVVELKAARYVRDTSPVVDPLAAPGGRAFRNCPPTYTTPLPYARAQTVLSVCQVCRAFELRLPSDCPTGSGVGAVAAAATADFPK